MDARRVVITGVGAVTPIGNTAEEFWTALIGGEARESGPSPGSTPRLLPTRIAGEVKGFDSLTLHRQEGRPQVRPVPEVRGGLRGDGGGGRGPRTWSGWTSTGSASWWAPASAGSPRCSRATRCCSTKGPDRVSPFFIPMLIVNMASGLISMRFGAKGPNSSVVTACATGNHAIGDAMRIIQRGDADVMIAGGAEAIIIPLTFAGFCQMKAMSTRNDDPARASRPFDADRDGFVCGEGGGLLVLESLEHALAARRADLRGGGGLRHDRRRLPHDRARSGGGRRRAGHGRWRCATRASSRRRSATSTPTAPRRPTTTSSRRSRSSASSASTPASSRSPPPSP